MRFAHVIRGVALTLLVAGCQEPDKQAPATRAAADGPGATPSEPASRQPPRADAEPTALASISDVPLGPTALLGKPPAEVEAQLDEPLGKGMARTTCVRFIPDRVWFECEYAEQRYGDKTGTFKAIFVVYEDGAAASLAYELKGGTGAFDPKAALAQVGIVPPLDPSIEQLDEGAKIWTWDNAQARLLLGEQQYRLRVSSVDDRWDLGKVEVLLNHPLTDAQSTKILAAKPRTPVPAPQAP